MSDGESAALRNDPPGEEALAPARPNRASRETRRAPPCPECPPGEPCKHLRAWRNWTKFRDCDGPGRVGHDEKPSLEVRREIADGLGGAPIKKRNGKALVDLDRESGADLVRGYSERMALRLRAIPAAERALERERAELEIDLATIHAWVYGEDQGVKGTARLLGRSSHSGVVERRAAILARAHAVGDAAARQDLAYPCACSRPWCRVESWSANGRPKKYKNGACREWSRRVRASAKRWSAAIAAKIVTKAVTKPRRALGDDRAQPPSTWNVAKAVTKLAEAAPVEAARAILAILERQAREKRAPR